MFIHLYCIKQVFAYIQAKIMFGKRTCKELQITCHVQEGLVVDPRYAVDIFTGVFIMENEHAINIKDITLH